jgi:hypothetical protein
LRVEDVRAGVTRQAAIELGLATAVAGDEEHMFAKSACGVMPQLSAYFLMKAVDFLAASVCLNV